MNKRTKTMRDNLLESLDKKLEKSEELFIFSNPALCKLAEIEKPLDDLNNRIEENRLQVQEIINKLLEIIPEKSPSGY